MINNVTELDMSDDGLVAEIRDLFGADKTDRIGDLPAVIALVRGIMELEPRDRPFVWQTVFGFVCKEYGKPSCLHGYPD